MGFAKNVASTYNNKIFRFCRNIVNEGVEKVNNFKIVVLQLIIYYILVTN